MINARDVADYFLSKTIDEDDTKLTNLKIQKLLYYTQGFHLAILDKALFDESIEAWRYGPVCPVVYGQFKKYKSNTISYDKCEKQFESIFDTKQIELLDDVYETFAQYSAWKLRDMTHEEPTWMKHKDDASVIPQQEMKEYFKTRIA